MGVHGGKLPQSNLLLHPAHPHSGRPLLPETLQSPESVPSLLFPIAQTDLIGHPRLRRGDRP
jgi:hypothetical protein